MDEEPLVDASDPDNPDFLSDTGNSTDDDADNPTHTHAHVTPPAAPDNAPDNNGRKRPKSSISESGKIRASFMRRRKSLAETETERERVQKQHVKDREAEQAVLSRTDRMFYHIENRIASSAWFPFILLGVFVSVILVGFGFLWYVLITMKNQTDEGVKDELSATLGFAGLSDSLFLSMQVLMASDFSEIPDVNGLRVVYFLMLFMGLVVFAILVGFITDTVSAFMNSLASGLTKVATDDHTLILGWNEATSRVIIQASLLRRQYQTMNEEKFFNLPYYFPVLLTLLDTFGMLEYPSTSIAANDIVIMTNTLTKEEMHLRVAQAMSERGIDQRITKIGRNIICRVGDPTSVNDLVRVGAQRAGAIVVMLTAQDNIEEDHSHGNVHNGATLRCTLALRHVMYTNKFSDTQQMNPNLRIILHMTSPSSFVDAANFKNDDGINVVHPMDLSVFLNTLMFTCANQPGLANVLMNMLNFEGKAIRRRKAQNLRSGEEDALGDCIGKTFKELKEQFTLAVFIGVIRPSVRGKLKSKERGFGLCPDPSLVIQEDDLLVFIGPRSNPKHDFHMVESMHEYADEAKEILSKYNLSGESMLDIESHTLLLGWRGVWEKNPSRFVARLTDLIKVKRPGSSIIMINAIENDSLAEYLKTGGYSRCEDTVYKGTDYESKNCTYAHDTLYPGVKIIHVVGDAARPHLLLPIIMSTEISSAIVLGTQSSHRLNPHSRDTRVLSITLLLRKLWSVKGSLRPMHIIGENEEDLTARLALTPCIEGSTSDTPDFVNSQAINARVLTQAMAYPGIASAIADLFEESEGSAKIVTAPAFSYVPKECFENRNFIHYGVVRNIVLQTKGERAIAIGWLSAATSEVHFTPPHDSEVCFNMYDKIIVIKRETS